MKAYFNKSEIMGIALLRAGTCAARDGTESLRGRLEELGLADDLRRAMDCLDRAERAMLDVCEDEDTRLGIERRINTYKIGLAYAKPERKQLHVVDDRDMQTLVGHCLNYCDLECPCVTVDDAGDRTVIKAAVKGCEMRRMYRRLMLCEGSSAECPYSMLV